MLHQGQLSHFVPRLKRHLGLLLGTTSAIYVLSQGPFSRRNRSQCPHVEYLKDRRPIKCVLLTPGTEMIAATQNQQALVDLRLEPPLVSAAFCMLPADIRSVGSCGSPLTASLGVEGQLGWIPNDGDNSL